jgi:hypothetical protein
MRKVVAILDVDDNRAIEEDLGTIDYVAREFDKVRDSGIVLNYAKIFDYDDKYDNDFVQLILAMVAKNLTEKIDPVSCSLSEKDVERAINEIKEALEI